VSQIRMQPKPLSCMLIHLKGGEDVVVGTYDNYEEAYQAAKAIKSGEYKVFKTIELFTRVREISFRSQKQFDQQLLIERDASAKERSNVLGNLSDADLQEKINQGGVQF
jgi:hypothetical protein